MTDRLTHRTDLTQGSVPRVLLRFALPFLMANVLQALYGGADLFVVGQFDDAASVAGVAIGSQVMQTATGIITGLTTGTTVLIAIGTGARDERQVARTIGTATWVFALMAVVLTAVMALGHTPLARLMQTPPEALRDTEHYLLVCSLGIPFIMGYNVVCGILRGLGDSRTPLYFVALACVANIVLDFALVGGLGLRAMGAAIATVLAQAASFITALWFLRRKGLGVPFTRSDVRPAHRLTRQMLTLGTPLALQDALINVSFLLITVIANQMGVVASAAVGVVEKIIVFAMLPPMAIASAVATMTAQNYGAGLVSRMKQCLRAGIAMALAFGVAVCLYAQFLPETLTGIFTHDAAVVAMAADYLRSYSFDCIAVAFVFCFNAYFSGQGNSWFPMTHSVVATFTCRIPLAFWFSRLWPATLLPMGFASPLATAVSMLLCFWFVGRSDRRLAAQFAGRGA